MLNRRMPNGTYGGVRGERKSPLLDYMDLELAIELYIYSDYLSDKSIQIHIG